MDILNLNKNIFYLLLSTLFIFSCRDKDRKCIDKEFNSEINIKGFKPSDKEIQEAYLLIYDINDFTNKTDSIPAKYIVNSHKKKDFTDNVYIVFDKLKMSTNENYILVANKKTKYQISNYVFKLDSVMVGMHLQKTCIIDSLKVNNSYAKDIGGTIEFNKSLGVPLK